MIMLSIFLAVSVFQARATEMNGCNSHCLGKTGREGCFEKLRWQELVSLDLAAPAGVRVVLSPS